MILLSLMCHQVVLTLFSEHVSFYLNFSISVATPLIQTRIHFPWFPRLRSLLYLIAVICLWFYCSFILLLLPSPRFLCIGVYDYSSGEASSPASILHACVPSYHTLCSF